jgi:cell fate (sporulation/competence/biofilm development) regulator YlbF (YheA/YmcA/DUF963 family)
MAITDQAASPVTEAAKALATALKSDDRYTAWRDTSAAFEQNEGLKNLMMQFQQLAQKAQMAQQGGQPLTNEEVAEITDVQKTLQDDVLFMKHNKVTAELLELLDTANQAVSAEIGLDFAANAAHQG